MSDTSLWEKDDAEVQRRRAILAAEKARRIAAGESPLIPSDVASALLGDDVGLRRARRNLDRARMQAAARAAARGE